MYTLRCLCVTAARSIGEVENYGINFICGFLVLTAANNVAEPFYYFCGACMYALPLTFGFAGLALYLFVINCNRKKIRVESKIILPTALLMLLGCGGVMPIAALINAAVFGITLFWYKDFQKNQLPILGLSLAGAALNLAAPGNYARQGKIGAELDIGGAMANTVKAVYDCSLSLVLNKYVQILLVLVFVVGFMYAKKSFKCSILRLAGVMLYGVLGGAL